MPNPTGRNQLSPHGYGDAQAQTQLLRSAPISGAPVAAQALNAPQRSQRRAVRGAPPDEPQPEAPSAAEVSPQAQVAAVWAQVAAIPGASDLVKQLASQS